MRHSKEDPSSSDAQVVDLISAVKELHGLSSQELSRLLRDSENFTIHYLTRKGSSSKIDMEKLAGSLPLHLIAVLISSDRDESMMRYVLCGIRLLYSLCDLSPRHSKLEQSVTNSLSCWGPDLKDKEEHELNAKLVTESILYCVGGGEIFLDDVKVLEQLIDLVFYVIIVLGGYRQEGHTSTLKLLLHSALVACSLHLLNGIISTQWQDVVHVLLAHPKVDIFMDVAFGSVRMVVRFLEITLSGYHEGDFVEPNLTAEQVVYFLTQQCEASLQFLQSLCQKKLFKERLLKNKELCGKGSILFLIRSILKLDIQPYFPTKIMAALSRLKSKILSLLLSLCEAENASYLDEVASSSQSLDLAKSVALEVFDVLKTAFGNNPQNLKNGKKYPMGFLQLNAMRLADIFSDDSNFRSYMTNCFTKVLAAIFMLSHGDFLSSWCSSSLPEKEEDATLEYDIFAAVGWILDNTSLQDLSNTANLEFNLAHNSMPQASYAHHRTSLFVKVIANLHCFVPNICEEQERNLFVLKVLECLQMDLSNLLPGFSFAPNAPNATSICKNLRSLLSHAESLIPNFLNVEDVHLLRVFSDKLESLITSSEFRANRVQDSKDVSCDKFSKLSINDHQEAQSPGGCSSPLPVKELLADLTKKSGNLREGMSENSAFLDINHFDARAEDINQGADPNPQDKMEDKIISAKTASEGARDADKDAQNVETSGSDTSSAKGKSVIDQMDNVELSKSAKRVIEVGVGENPEDEKVETKQRKKRKRTIMNDNQVMLIERALLDEPEMQRNAASLLSWAEKLSHHGSEVTPSQLKNWLNNRKARLARTARDVRAAADVDTSVLNKQKGPVQGSYDSPDSPSDASNARKEHPSHSNVISGHKADSLMAEFVDLEPPEAGCKTGQCVVLVDKRGEEIGKGKVFQVSGKWCGKSLEELETCVVDVYELKADKGSRLPYPSEATGSSFSEAETKLGVMRVLWDSNRIFVLRSE